MHGEQVALAPPFWDPRRSDMTSGVPVSPSPGDLSDALAAIYDPQQDGTVGQAGTAATAWIRRLHGAFYGRELARVPNKFQHLEKVLADAFGRSSEADGAFWRFVTDILVRLGSNDGVPPPKTADATKKKKKEKESKDKAQPTSPLAFLVVNALKALMDGEAARDHRRLCRIEGKTNTKLRDFCVSGLGSGSTVDQKLLVELIEVFHITDIDSSLVDEAVNGLLSSKNHSAVIKLCAIHRQAQTRLPEIAGAMAQAKDWVSAELLVRTFDDSDTKKLAKILVETAINVRDFKRAHRLVSNFALQEAYPSIDILYSRDGLARLIENKRWQLAITFVGSDPNLQRMLLTHMLAVGEVSFATQLLERIPAGDDKQELMKLVSESAECEAEASSSPRNSQSSDSTKNEYLELRLGRDAVVFCDSEDGVREAINHFFPLNQDQDEAHGVTTATPSQRHVVGLDVEWKPVSSRSASSSSPVASILQIASASAIVIVDLLKLHDSDLLFESFLHRLFTSVKHLKVGFNFESDLKVLSGTFPERAAFTEITTFFDLKIINDTSSGSAGGNSLSAATTRFLGKPLNKKMQLSDWEQRPLSSQQLEYAALDAYCLVQIVEIIAKTNSTSLNASTLSLATRLGVESVAQCVSRRNNYQDVWKARVTESAATHSLVTSQEVVKFWRQKVDQCQSIIARYQENDPRFAEMSLVRYTTLQLLRASSGGAGCEEFCPVNSICLFAADQPSVVCIDARRKLDMSKLARAFRVGRRKVRLATATECAKVFGFAPGTVAPFGHRSSTTSSTARIPVYADSSLQNASYLAAGSGSAETVVWLKSAAFFAVIDIESIADFAVTGMTDDEAVETRLTESCVGNGLNAAIGNTQSALEYKFLADSMVAQVGRWLRTTGVDVAIWKDMSASSVHDPKREMLAKAARENRIVLTRDTQLPGRRDAGACFVLSDDECFKQFREVKAQFGLLWKREERASRCARCNSTSFAVVDLEFVRKQTSKNVQKALESVTKFWKCDECCKIYWEGPKYTPTTASLGTTDDGFNVKYRPVAQRRVQLVLNENTAAIA